MKTKYCIYLLALIMFGACTEVEVDSPVFDVSLSNDSLNSNQEVTFKFSGNPDQIAFYSGEPLNDYAFRDGRILKVLGLNVSFGTTVQYGDQDNQFAVLASTDFNGIYEIDDVNAATWQDITDSYPLATDTELTPWGPKNLSDILVEDKPIFIAFRYTTLPQEANGKQRSWVVKDFELNSQTDIGVQTLADLVGAEFKLVDNGAAESGRTYMRADRIGFRGNRNDTEALTVNWAITKPFLVGDQDLGPDKSIPVKGFVDASSSQYTHVYSKPGTYTATFVASNQNVYGNKQVVKQVEVTIQP